MHDKEKRIGFALVKGSACSNRNVGAAYEIGKIEGAIDGVGVRYNALGASGNVALGPVDVSIHIYKLVILEKRTLFSFRLVQKSEQQKLVQRFGSLM